MIEKSYENVNFQVKHKNMTPPRKFKWAKSPERGLFAELLSRAPFLQVNRGEFGNVVQPHDSLTVNPSLLKATSHFFLISLFLGNLQNKNRRFKKVTTKTFLKEGRAYFLPSSSFKFLKRFRFNKTPILTHICW